MHHKSDKGLLGQDVEGVHAMAQSKRRLFAHVRDDEARPAAALMGNQTLTASAMETQPGRRGKFSAKNQARHRFVQRERGLLLWKRQPVQQLPDSRLMAQPVMLYPLIQLLQPVIQLLFQQNQQQLQQLQPLLRMIIRQQTLHCLQMSR